MSFLFSSFAHGNSQPRVEIAFTRNLNKVCITGAHILFPPMTNLATAWGRVTVDTKFGFQRALTITGQIGDKTTYSPASNSLCNANNQPFHLSINPGVIVGKNQMKSYNFKIPWVKAETHPKMSFSLPATFSGERAAQPLLSSRSSFRVTREVLNEAVLALGPWERSELRSSTYRRSGLSRIDKTDGLLEVFSQYNERHQFASNQLAFVLRRTAKLNQLLGFQEPLVVADISREDGATPYISDPGLGRTYLHPEGSHTNGRDADIVYFGHKGQISELDFWTMFGILMNTGVDLVMTSYKEQYVSWAQEAYKSGLVSEIALARFESSQLQQHGGLNHDKHFHIAVANDDNEGKFVGGQLFDNVYNCYIKLKPGGKGAGGNFCKSRPF